MADQSPPVSNEDPLAEFIAQKEREAEQRQVSFITAVPNNTTIAQNPSNPTVATVTVNPALLPGTQSPAPVEDARIVKISKPAGDWRARLQLAPSADYLYKAAQPGILGPLTETDGVVFPYTPTIETMYHAAYAETQLTHSNWKGYHYTGSHPGTIVLTATFTAQDNKEAEYLLAALHFFRAATKMFYGQDYERGTPPPVLFLSAFGEYQYNRVPVVIQDFTSSMPPDVHYVRTKYGQLGTGLGVSESSTMSPLRSIVKSINEVANRLQSLGNIGKGGTKTPTSSSIITRAATENTSYVPSKVDVTLNLLPIPNRKQMSQEFSFKDYANGTLITKGII